MLEMILAVIVIISFLLFIFVIYNNRFQLSIIKIEKAEEDISMYLQKKCELLERTRPIIKKELKVENYMEDLDQPLDSFNNFQLHNTLKTIYNELFKIMDENEKLLKSESLQAILEDLDENEENIVGAIKFYNDTVVDFNHLTVAFPSKLIAWIKHYHKKEFYNNEKREMFEILNQK